MKKVYRSPIQRRYAAMTEYIIILALVAIGSIAVFNIFGDQIRSVIGASAKQMAGDSSADPTDQTSGVDGEVSKSIGDF
jgi:Flp pilus assembly pilin Flp